MRSAEPRIRARPTFAALLEHAGVEEILELRSRFGIMAFHGGSLEKVTDVIAADAARAGGASLYAVRQPADLEWHIPSHAFDPASSPRLAAFLDHVEVVVAVHGYGRHGRWTDVLLGGSNRQLAGRLAAHLTGWVEGYAFVTELPDIPTALRGLHPQNPVNRPPGGGVQLELPPRIRGLSPVWADWAGPGLPPPTQGLIAGLARFAEAWARGSSPVRGSPPVQASSPVRGSLAGGPLGRPGRPVQSTSTVPPTRQ